MYMWFDVNLTKAFESLRIFSFRIWSTLSLLDMNLSFQKRVAQVRSIRMNLQCSVKDRQYCKLHLNGSFIFLRYISSTFSLEVFISSSKRVQKVVLLDIIDLSLNTSWIIYSCQVTCESLPGTHENLVNCFLIVLIHFSTLLLLGKKMLWKNFRLGLGILDWQFISKIYKATSSLSV